jgi:hypothetical protein
VPHRRSPGPRVLAQIGEITVESDPARPSGRLLRHGGMDLSYNDLADPRHLEFDYLRWMRSVLLAARARRVLHVGGAGCALARALAAADPDGRQEVWEIDPTIVEIARGHLGLARAPGLRVRLGDGAAALVRTPEGSHHAVVIDAFVGAAVAPGPSSPGFLQEAARVAPLSLVNVVDDRTGREVARLAAGLAGAYPRVWTIVGRSHNTVLGADRGTLDLSRLQGPLAADPSPAVLDVLRT